MKQLIVTFHESNDIANPGGDERKLRFSYTVVPSDKVGKSDEHKYTSEHQITVSVVKTICAPWQCKGVNVDLILFEAGRQQVDKVWKSGERPRSLDFDLTPPDYTGASVPFDTSRIPSPAGHRMIVEVQTTIGF